MRNTMFLDIDGTLVYHHGTLPGIYAKTPQPLPGVLDKLKEWRDADHYLILTTARPEGMRHITEKQLAEVGIFYDQLVMGLPTGKRYVFNDHNDAGQTRAFGVPLVRDVGIGDVEI